MTNLFREFAKDEAGAVTVDFVALSSAVMIMAFGIIALLQVGTYSVGDRVSNKVSITEVGGN